MFKQRKLLAIGFLLGVFLFAGETGFALGCNLPDSHIFLADKFYRTELYFGTDIAGGGKVSGDDWNKFLAAEVTPRFPDGFTVLEGFGQYKDAAGRIVREASKILVLFYPKKSRREVNRKVEEIRAAYKKQFSQESVLRLDFTRPVEVSF